MILNVLLKYMILNITMLRELILMHLTKYFICTYRVICIFDVMNFTWEMRCSTELSCDICYKAVVKYWSIVGRQYQRPKIFAPWI